MPLPRQLGASAAGTSTKPAPPASWLQTQAWLRSHPVLLDCLLVMLLDALVLVSLVRSGEVTSWRLILLSQLLVLPLVVRRRYPWPVFGLLAVIAAAHWLVGVRFTADAALLVALYTVAAHCSRRRAITAAVIVEIGVVLASVRFAPTGDGVFGSMVLLSGMVAAALFSGMTLRTRRQYLAALTERASRLERERDQQARLAATAERTRIARELHDVIAHSLSVIITLADAAVLANEQNRGQAHEAMSQVAATGRASLSEMRRLLGVLRDDDKVPTELAPQPGMDRIDTLVAELRGTGLPVQLVTMGAPRPLPPTAQAAVYRIVQEGLTNALKHADHPTVVKVQMRWSVDALCIEVVDNGHSLAPGSRTDVSGDEAGHGLIGMRERAGLFHGTMAAGPTTSGGWRVLATLPLTSES